MRKTKEQGITLIALVLTIIILLILAGVVLSMVFNGGIIDKSQKAVDKTRAEGFKEEVTIAMIDRKLEPQGTLEENLNASITGNKTIEKAGNVNDICYVTKNGDTVTVYENGEVVEGRVSIWDGTTSEINLSQITDNKIHIYTCSDLKWLEETVNEGNTLEGYTVYLENDLDLGAREENGILKSGTEWIPIGNSSTILLKATFEGQNHTIRGVYVNQSTDYAGIFGNSYTVNDLTIKDSYIKGSNRVGGILGALNAESINNCHNINTKISGIDRVGGVVGNIDTSALSVTNCSNSGSVEGTGVRIGGVVGNFSGTNMVSYCNNSGSVTGQGESVGGVVGYAYTSATVTGCNNNGSVTGVERSVGGVVGHAGKSTTITGCNNSGNVTGRGDRVGGVVGYVNTSSTITECNNSGAVTGQNYVGGIAGVASSIVTKCSNTGNVIGNGTNETGGIVGDSVTGQGQDISLCYNSGEVRGNGQVGGISGYLGSANANPTGKEYKCYNKGKVINTGTTGIAGGVVGHMAQDANVTNCYYLNTIGVDRGVYSIGSGGDIDLQNQGATAVSDDLTYEEFKTWIETK